MRNVLLGAVEAGGTKMVCAVAREPGVVLAEDRFATTGPAETLRRVKDYFDRAQKEFGQLGAIGYGTFGPAVVSEGAAKYGTILATPKPGWEGTDVIGFLKRSFPGVGLAFDTDVNAAAVGEGFAGAARWLKNFIYVTVGTGIGGGVIVDGKVLRTGLHAEIGHMLVPRQEGEVDGFPGVCRFHGGCLEGLASGTAMGQRWGIPAEKLGPDHEGWDLEAGYLAAMVQNLVACYAPERIILGGGVMDHAGMLEQVKAKFDQYAGGYWEGLKDLLVCPALGGQAGVTGALLMAERACG